ncbi:hypothetical protein BG006_004223 [Podila minutissima]|uniref:Voltage-gated hydrogen channel 1 n=1 Tax=Podila minutissima TaxID=64525 RepID=A0A9P5SLZ6_9FUNG|nr:hypothetical protein BG006_004223 [Podila minutissima]
MSSYGAIPTSEQEADNVNPLDNSYRDNSDAASDFTRSRHEVGEVIESKKAHKLILVLTVIDILLVILQIAASLLNLDDSKEAQWILELFANISLGIVTFFVFEILLKLYAFGPGYFWKGQPMGLLHLADAIIIIVSFLMEVFLSGAEQELGSLLIIFRLWRLIKLTSTVAIETTEHNHGAVKALEERVKELEHQLEESQAEVQRLRAQTE